MININPVLAKLGLEATGKYMNNMYEIPLADSNEFAKMYTLLGKNAVNTEEPGLGLLPNKTLGKITNYFEIEDNNIWYNIFLIADFQSDTYTIRIGER